MAKSTAATVTDLNNKTNKEVSETRDSKVLPYSNLVFEGGGVKGVPMFGALKAFEASPFKLKLTEIGLMLQVPPAGTITAMLVGFKYDIAGITKELSDINFSEFC